MEKYTLKDNSRYSIHTPTGFKKFDGIRKLNKSKYYKITLSNTKTIIASDTHPFMYQGNQVLVNTLKPGSCIDSTNVDEIVTVVSIDLITKNVELYDIVQVEGGNIFNVDGVVSHNCSFISSGNTVIDPELLNFYKETYCQDPLEKTGIDGNLWKWEYPDYSRTYMVVVDVSRGDGKDFSTCHVLDVETVTQVAEYKGKMDTTDFGNFLVSLATEYNEALLVIENANVGWAVIQQVINREYGNLFYMSNDMKYVDTARHISNKFNASERGLKAGFTTSTRTRPLIISKLDTYFRERTITIRSTRLIDELLVFIWNNQKATAMRGYNDDLVMALAIGLWVRDTSMRLLYENAELTKAGLSGIESSTPVGVYGGSNAGPNPWEMSVNGNSENVSWLLDDSSKKR